MQKHRNLALFLFTAAVVLIWIRCEMPTPVTRIAVATAGGLCFAFGVLCNRKAKA